MKLIAISLFLAVLLPACREEPKQRPAPPVAPAPPPPPDQLRPGELAEGTVDAFGIKLPRVMNVDTRFPDAVFASADVPAKNVVNYVRERVIAERVTTLPTKTVFEGATSKAAPTHKLRIEVIAHGSTRTNLVVRDETRPPAKPGLTEEERWRQVGMTPQGELIDPSHLN
ncbi:MAG: hypothetical protein IPM54_41815 [Polyangiaceae bacterium]|nr:hypothetical protein [Polyangiaceae bacterium]